jgi:ribosomal protein L19
MSGSVGVERIFPVNLPALQKVEINKKRFVELEFSTLENLLVKKQN